MQSMKLYRYEVVNDTTPRHLLARDFGDAMFHAAELAGGSNMLSNLILDDDMWQDDNN